MTDDELDGRVRESILAEKVDTSRLEAAVRQQIQAQPRHVPGWAVAAAALIATVLAAAFSYQAFRKEQTPPVCIAATQDHQREIVEGSPRRWITDLAAIQSLGETQGVPGSAIAALARTGYRLDRARLCSLKKQIFLHLVYTRDGRPYSVYLRAKGGDPSFSNAVGGSANLAYFQANRVTAVFVSQAGVQAFARAGLRSLTVAAL
jgi:hypothetical protein